MSVVSNLPYLRLVALASVLAGGCASGPAEVERTATVPPATADPSGSATRDEEDTLFDRIGDPSGVDSGEVPARDTLVGPE